MRREVGPKAGALVLASAVGLLALGLWLSPGRRVAGGFTGGGCCGGGPWGAPLARRGQGAVTEEARKAALAHTRTKLGTLQGVTVRVIDYGCHIGVDVRRHGKLLFRLAYRGKGRVEEV